MTPALFNPDADEAFDLFIGTAVARAEDLYLSTARPPSADAAAPSRPSTPNSG